MARLRKHYDEVVRKNLTEKFGYENPMAVPRVTKIVINMGVGEASQDKKKIEGAVDNLAAIAGQKPIITKSKQGGRQLQAARKPDGRLLRHAAQKPDV